MFGLCEHHLDQVRGVYGVISMKKDETKKKQFKPFFTLHG